MTSHAPRRSSACGPISSAVARLFVLLAGLLAIGGCRTMPLEYVFNGFKVGPNYSPPQAPVAPHWIDYHDPRVRSEAPPDWAWWRVFKDPVLDELIQTAANQNITLRDAGFRVQQSRDLRAIAIGGLFPQSQTFGGSYNRRMNSYGTNITAGGASGVTGAERFSSVWNTAGQLAWELDFWGRFRRAIEAQDAALDASVENYDYVLVLLIGDLATSYVQLRAVEQRIAYAQQNVAAQRGSMEMAKTRQVGGAGNQLDVAQAITNVAQTEAQIPVLQIQLRQAQNNLCVLLGIPPQHLQPLLSRSRGIPTPPPEVAIGIPADLIRRRPDVRMAEREIAAQSARIGIAEADLYPAFTLTGNVYTQATIFKDLFTSTSVGGNFSPSFSWNPLNYGRFLNNIRAQESLYMQEVAQYQAIVLNANREVEDGIVQYLRSQEQRRFLRESVAAAQESRDLVNELYTGGIVDFNRVFVAELSLQQQQDTLAQSEGLIALGLVNIYRALGGGWEIRTNCLPPMSGARPEALDPPLPSLPGADLTPEPLPEPKQGPEL